MNNLGKMTAIETKEAILGFYGRIDGTASTELTQQVKLIDEPPQQVES